MTIQKRKCPFCDPEREVIRDSKSSFAIYDRFPVSIGHVLIIPRRHCENYFELTPEEQNDCIELLNDVRIIIKEKYNTAFDLFINY